MNTLTLDMIEPTNAHSPGAAPPLAVPTAAGAEPKPSARRPRLTRFDTSRFVAACGVVWIHAAFYARVSIRGHGAGASPRELGSFAVPFFTIAAIFFTVGSVLRQPGRSFLSHVRSRFARLYVPFAAWSLVYIAVRAIQNHGRGLGTPIGFPLLYNGGNYHLWFLPFILVVTTAVFPLAGLVLRRPSWAARIATTGAILGIAVALVPTPTALGRESLFALRCAWPQLPSLFWGVALASLYYTGFREKLGGIAVGRIGLCAAICGVAAPLVAGREPALNMLANVSGLGLALWSLGSSDESRKVGSPRFPMNAGRQTPETTTLMARLGAASYGVYLSHALFVGVLRATVFRHLSETALSTAAVAWGISLAASLVLTLLLMRVRWLRWLAA